MTDVSSSPELYSLWKHQQKSQFHCSAFPKKTRQICFCVLNKCFDQTGVNVEVFKLVFAFINKVFTSKRNSVKTLIWMNFPLNSSKLQHRLHHSDTTWCVSLCMKWPAFTNVCLILSSSVFTSLQMFTALYQLRRLFLHSVTQTETVWSWTWILRPADNLTFPPTWKENSWHRILAAVTGSDWVAVWKPMDSMNIRQVSYLTRETMKQGKKNRMFIVLAEVEYRCHSSTKIWFNGEADKEKERRG